MCANEGAPTDSGTLCKFSSLRSCANYSGLPAHVARNDHRVDQQPFVYCLFASVVEQRERPLVVSANAESSTSTPPTSSSVISQPVAVNDIYCRHCTPAPHVSGNSRRFSLRIAMYRKRCHSGWIVGRTESACAISNGKLACRTVKSAWRLQLPVSRIRTRRSDSRVGAA